MLWQYGGLLVRSDQFLEATNIYKKGWEETAEIDFLHSLVNQYSYAESYDKIIRIKEDIVKDNSNVLMFELGFAYLSKGDSLNAGIYFTTFTKSFKFVNHEPYVQIEYENTVSSIRPASLEVLGDFYSIYNNEKSCEYYSYAMKQLNTPKNDRFFERKLNIETDELKKQKLINKMKEYQLKQELLLNRIEEKYKACK